MRVGNGRNTASRVLFRKRELTEPHWVLLVSSAKNSVSSLWHTNNWLRGTHWVLSPELGEGQKTHWARCLKPDSPKPYSARFRAWHLPTATASPDKSFSPCFNTLPLPFLRAQTAIWGVTDVRGVWASPFLDIGLFLPVHPPFFALSHLCVRAHTTWEIQKTPSRSEHFLRSSLWQGCREIWRELRPKGSATGARNLKSAHSG